MPRLNFKMHASCFTLALLLFPTITSAQTDSGRIGGFAKDENGALIPGAEIAVINDRTGEERNATTNTDGNFTVTGLRASPYTVTAMTNGLGAKVQNVVVNVGQEVTLNLTLKVASLTASVDVVAGADVAISTGSAAMGANVNPREVQGLPLNGRQLSQLYLQAPGSVNSGSGTYGDIRFSGRAVEQNEIRYDGIEGTAIIDASPGNLNGEVPSPFQIGRAS